MTRVAFLGAGSMGGRMARRVIEAGHDTIVCDPSEAVRERLGAQGARVTADAADCASADLVIVMVATGEQMKDALLAPGGFLDRVEPGREPLVAIMSTVLPGTCEEVRGPLVAAGLRVIDAPVSGGLVGAEEGTLAIMAGGDEADIDAAMPVFELMGRIVFRCGAFGSGERMKIVNNMLGVAAIYLGAEAFQLALRSGLSIERLVPVLEASSGRNFMTGSAAGLVAQYRAWAADRAVFDSLGDIVRKDLGLARSLSEEAGLRLPILEALAGSLTDLDEAAYRRWRDVAEADGA